MVNQLLLPKKDDEELGEFLDSIMLSLPKEARDICYKIMEMNKTQDKYKGK